MVAAVTARGVVSAIGTPIVGTSLVVVSTPVVLMVWMEEECCRCKSREREREGNGERMEKEEEEERHGGGDRA